MTNKKKTDKKESAPKKEAEKLILCEAVAQHPEQEYIIVGALSSADLLQQYRKELAVYGIEDIEPSITMDELDKIIKKFLGE